MADVTLVLASNNAGKLRELLALTAGLPVQVRPQSDWHVEDAIENGLSFIENALIKARHAARATGRPALADDSGLVVPCLGGAPGIHSARFAGEHGNDARNNQVLLDGLRPLRSPDQPIVGRFVCVLALVRHAKDPLPLICQGVWSGEILAQPQGDQGFGYDPLFWLPEWGMSSAELPRDLKNRLSHRAQAMQQLVQQLPAWLAASGPDPLARA